MSGQDIATCQPDPTHPCALAQHAPGTLEVTLGGHDTETVTREAGEAMNGVAI
jgi:hypothetical protein